MVLQYTKQPILTVKILKSKKIFGQFILSETKGMDIKDIVEIVLLRYDH